MRKIIILMLIISCAAVTAGCAGSNALSVQSRADVNRRSEQGTWSRDASASMSYIGEEATKAAALNHAGIDESEVTYERIHLDRDDGRILYDIEFYSDNREYDYEINAYTGAVMSYNYDINYHSESAVKSNEDMYISREQAKSIALQQANLMEDQTARMKVSFEYEDRLPVYQIEFFAGGMEYEVEINAVDGTIVEYDTEFQD